MGGPAVCPLSPREFEVLSLLAAGRTYRQAAAELHVGHSTVQTHARSCFRRLGVRGQRQAFAKMAERGWWSIADPTAPPGEVPLPPFAAAYLEQLDRWLASGTRDRHARAGMKIALLGLKHGAGG